MHFKKTRWVAKMKETTATDIIQTLPPEKVSLSWTTETLNIHLSKVIEAFVKLVYEKDGGVRQLIEERSTDYKNRFAAVELDQQHKWDSQEKAVRLAFEAHDAQMHTMFEAQEKFNQQRYDNQVQSCNENFDAVRKTQIASTQESDQKVVAMFEAYKTSKQQRWEAQEKAQDIAYKTIEKTIAVASIEHDKQISTAFAAQEKVHQQRWESQERAVSAAFMAQEKLVRQAMESAQLAVAKSETAMEKRFESMNEFRNQLRDQAALFLQRTEFTAVITSISEKIEALSTTLSDKLEGNVKSLQGKIDAQNNNYTELRTARDTSAGKSDGLNQGWVILLGIVSLMGGIISMIVFFKP